MIGLDFPIKPEWISDVLQLWKPRQPIKELIQDTLSQTMQELGGEKTRRNSLSIILRNFVTIEGKGNSRHTVDQDLWVEYSRQYSISEMAPVYLTQIISNNDVARDASEFIDNRYTIGDKIVSAELKRQIISKYGERKVVTNSVSAFLRTLQYFHVLSDGEKLGEYLYTSKPETSREVFPLLVWSWWKSNRQPQIDLEMFEHQSERQFLDTENFNDYWRSYQTELWTISERLDGKQANLIFVDSESFQEAMITTIINPIE